MTTSATGQAPGARPEGDTVEVLQAATRALVGVALRSLDVLGGEVSLPQFRVLAVLADVGPARSGRVARALGLEASTVTRLADRLVASAHVTRGGDPQHRGVVMLALSAAGRDLVRQVESWRRTELSRILERLGPDDRDMVIRALRLLVEAAGEGYGSVLHGPVPL